MIVANVVLFFRNFFICKYLDWEWKALYKYNDPLKSIYVHVVHKENGETQSPLYFCGHCGVLDRLSCWRA